VITITQDRRAITTSKDAQTSSARNHNKMKQLNHETIVKINLKPKQVAKLFESMNSKEMATFFNELGNLIEKWNHGFSFQMQYLTNKINLTDKARAIMNTIGQYAYKQD